MMMRKAKPGRSGKFVSLDFDSRRLRIVQVSYHAHRARLNGLASVVVPADVDMTNAESAGKFIGQTLRSMGLRGSHVLMNVPRAQAVLKPLILPAGTQEAEMASMVQFQIGKELPFPAEDAVVDFTIESHFDSGGTADAAVGVGVLVSAVRLGVVDYYRQVAEHAGVRLQRLGLRPYANMRCIDRCVQRGPDERVVLVNLTADEAEIDVFVGDSLAFSRSAAVKAPDVPPTADAGIQAVNSVVLEVTRSLQSYLAVNRGPSIEGLLVAGDTGLERAVATALQARVDAKCELLDPTEALALKDEANPSAFVAALGLAVTDGETATVPFDFLNPKRPPVQRDTRKVKVACVAIFAGSLLMASLVFGGRYISDQRKRVRAIARQVQEQEKINKGVVALRRRAEAVADWQDQGVDWTRHISLLTREMLPPDQAYLTHLSAVLDPVRPDDARKITFTVRAKNKETIDSIEAKLEKIDGYSYPTRSRVMPTYKEDPVLGFNWEGKFEVIVADGMAPDLNEAPPERREDDASAESWMQEGKHPGSRGALRGPNGRGRRGGR